MFILESLLGWVCLIPGLSGTGTLMGSPWTALSGFIASTCLEVLAPKTSGNSLLTNSRADKLNHNPNIIAARIAAALKVWGLAIGAVIGLILPFKLKGLGGPVFSVAAGCLILFIVWKEIKVVYLLGWLTITAILSKLTPDLNGPLVMGACLFVIPSLLGTRRKSVLEVQHSYNGLSPVLLALPTAFLALCLPGVSLQGAAVLSLAPMMSRIRMDVLMSAEGLLEGLALGNLEWGAAGKALVAPLLGQNVPNFLMIAFSAAIGYLGVYLITEYAPNVYKKEELTQFIGTALAVLLVLLLNPFKGIICIALGCVAHYIAEIGDLPNEVNTLTFLTAMVI